MTTFCVIRNYTTQEIKEKRFTISNINWKQLHLQQVRHIYINSQELY